MEALDRHVVDADEDKPLSEPFGGAFVEADEFGVEFGVVAEPAVCGFREETGRACRDSSAFEVGDGDVPFAREHGDKAGANHVLDRHLVETGPYVTGATFTLGDIPIGLVVNRWFHLNFARPDYPAVARYYETLSQRPAYMRHVRNGLP